jgi:hypothetical protein
VVTIVTSATNEAASSRYHHRPEYAAAHAPISASSLNVFIHHSLKFNDG